MKRIIAKSVVALAAAAGLFSIPTTAQAGHRDSGYVNVNFRAEQGRRWVEPVYEERATRVWVEPVYRDECVPVFVKGYYKDVCEKVWVEPVYQIREVVKYDRHGCRTVCRERVCVREGGWQTVTRQEWVPPHYRNETRRVCVREGYWDVKRERVCVREGRWETCHPHRDREHVGFSVNFGGVFR